MLLVEGKTRQRLHTSGQKNNEEIRCRQWGELTATTGEWDGRHRENLMAAVNTGAHNRRIRGKQACERRIVERSGGVELRTEWLVAGKSIHPSRAPFCYRCRPPEFAGSTPRSASPP